MDEVESGATLPAPARTSLINTLTLGGKTSKTTRQKFLPADILSGLPPKKPLLFGKLRVRGSSLRVKCGVRYVTVGPAL